MGVHVDHDRCVGSGLCVQDLPAVFALGGDGLAVVIEGGRASRAELEDVELLCPSAAILLDHED